MSTLGFRLRKAREKKKWSQTYVCKKIGISNSTLSGYERDYREPDADMISTFSEIYEVTTDYLLGRSNNPSSTYNQDDLPPMLQDIDPILARRFIEALKDSKTELFFDNILGASPEEREELIEEFLQMRKELRKKQQK